MSYHDKLFLMLVPEFCLFYYLEFYYGTSKYEDSIQIVNAEYSALT